MSNQTAFHLKYRPRTLARLIGHESAVTRLRGLIASGKVPNALGFFGPTSAGKTTMARAFAAELNGVASVDALKGDYMEVNAADQKTIDDVRNLIKISRFRPTTGKYRVIVIDEAQQLLTNKQAAQALLKPLEDAPASTIWILCSMEPQRFGATIEGKAIVNRCVHFVLESHTDEDLMKQARRIAKAEEMLYAKPILEQIVQASGREMRTLANIMQSVHQYYEGLADKPKRLDADSISTVIRSVSGSEDDLAFDTLIGIYSGSFGRVLRSILDVKDGFSFVQKLIWGNSYLMYKAALEGKNHPELKHWAPLNRKLADKTKANPVPLDILAELNVELSQLRSDILTQGSPFIELASSRLYRAVKKIVGTD